MIAGATRCRRFGITPQVQPAVMPCAEQEELIFIGWWEGNGGDGADGTNRKENAGVCLTT
jgi:hypothetical protein